MESTRRRMHRKLENIGRYNPRKMAPTSYMWRPCVPRWEREFTSKIGNIKWKDFVEAKKYIYLDNKIMDWNDFACKEAFTATKTRFWDHYNGYESKVSLPDPDMHIDKNIDWTSESQENNESEDPMLSISDAENDLSDSGVMNQIPRMLPPLKMEDILPTGWDVDDVTATTDLLIGLIVGDDDSEDDNILQDSINIKRELPTLRKFLQLG